jgi:hypothetical protein
VIQAGEFWGSDVDFDPGDGTDLHSGHGSGDSFCSKFDSSGNFLWASTFGGSDTDYSSDVSITQLGRILLAGRFCSSNVEFAPVGSPCFDDSDIRDAPPIEGAFLVKYMPDGCR